MESFTSFWFVESRNDLSDLGRKKIIFLQMHNTISAKSKKFSKCKNDKL